MKIIFALLFVSSVFAQDCRPSMYRYQDKTLCFSLKHKAYFTETCSGEKCEAMNFIAKSKAIHLTKMPAQNDAAPGSATCGAVGGKVEMVKADKLPDQLCLCLAPDLSGVSCSKLGLR